MATEGHVGTSMFWPHTYGRLPGRIAQPVLHTLADPKVPGSNPGGRAFPRTVLLKEGVLPQEGKDLLGKDRGHDHVTLMSRSVENLWELA